mmetsp:Transcript_4160/g.7631  ORF Transcript_4160/g.7631 Transcript_4160/m.7631 type:complete len:222 (-) Transcript_4160:229-894(-)|eukprot:CAMPEP_0178752894 /NCGR_PEP_ID=MMETSP0744-20121128/11316_1 /TAXON_ID=913974 /ORGANISM="Nitzschia punctata, Strain CCMP561" /LENGTH=221 /DNA_ID=CAMNT_0020406663 /DNA_START=285 /DNA_END=950 /DNA_ORIENTATION=+
MKISHVHFPLMLFVLIGKTSAGSDPQQHSYLRFDEGLHQMSTELDIDSSPDSRNLGMADYCPPKQYAGWWWWKKERPGYKFWQAFNDITDPSFVQAKGLARLVFNDGEGLGAAKNIYDSAYDNISDRNGCLPGVWETLLNIWCANDKLQDALGNILDANTIISVINVLGSTASMDVSQVIVSVVENNYAGNSLEGATGILQTYTTKRAFATALMAATWACN